MILKGIQIEMNEVGEIPSIGEIYNVIKGVEIVKVAFFSDEIFVEDLISKHGEEYYNKHSRIEKYNLLLNDRIIWKEWLRWDEELVYKWLSNVNTHPWICYFLSKEEINNPGYFDKRWAWSYHNYDDSIVEVFCFNDDIVNKIRAKYVTKDIQFPGLIGVEGD
jgi:hypothetical protein